MAKFDPPWAFSGEVRLPTTNEQSGGFACGPADMYLFNKLFGRIEAELKSIQAAGGIAGSDTDDTTVLKAINALIAAATGGGDTSQFVLFTQARSRLPLYPEVLNGAGHLGVITPATGQIRIPAGVVLLHRGIFPITTVQTDFATDPSKTYHLRWDPVNGFRLLDVASGAYNPGALAEFNPAFDSTYDDVLLARISTNSSNVATITNLVNKVYLNQLLLTSQTVTRTSSVAAGGQWVADVTPITLNWARTPRATAVLSRVGYNGDLLKVPEEISTALTGTASDASGTITAILNRYTFKPLGTMDLNEANVSRTFGIQMSATLIA